MRATLSIRTVEGFDAAKGLLERRWPKAKTFDSELANYVGAIIEEVRRRGDAALFDFTEKFDDVKLDSGSLKVNPEEFEKAYSEVSEDIVSALKTAKERVEKFQRRLLKRLSFECETEGVKIRNVVTPIRRLGCYVPGGEAAYPSSLVMIIAPAKVAGVHEIAVCSPPRSNGEVSPLILVAADLCGVNEVYKVGGAQAIAAMAYGTETIKPVDKIVGPGNRYVLTAKMLVSRDLPVDMPAGPSEIIVLADELADPREIALDMVSQAEHLDGVSALVTTSKEVAEKVVEELRHMVSSLPNREMVVRNLSRNGFILVCKNMKEAVLFVNKFGPEHLEIMAKDARRIAGQVTSAGLVLVGRWTPVAASDYGLGTVHVLPTQGFSHVYSGLSVLDFIKRFSIVECSEEGLLKAKDTVKVLANSEGLLNHGLAVEGRFDNA
ncbi:histidinol dehydrogenase [Candidatus Bathyarchaeota archaeon]|nr:MAG: histidinol dehydrogenase [Candidatus Bathyarchaeota archaeon]